jgi:hypothetical protein
MSQRIFLLSYFNITVMPSNANFTILHKNNNTYKQVFSFIVKNNVHNSRQILEVTLWYSNFHRRSKTAVKKILK